MIYKNKKKELRCSNKIKLAKMVERATQDLPGRQYAYDQEGGSDGGTEDHNNVEGQGGDVADGDVGQSRNDGCKDHGGDQTGSLTLFQNLGGDDADFVASNGQNQRDDAVVDRSYGTQPYGDGTAQHGHEDTGVGSVETVELFAELYLLFSALGSRSCAQSDSLCLGFTEFLYQMVRFDQTTSGYDRSTDELLHGEDNGRQNCS